MFSRVQKLGKPFFSCIKGSSCQLFSTASPKNLSPLINMQETFRVIQEQKCFTSAPLEPDKLIQFDKLTETPYSETFRGFDRDLERFVSIKNLDLNFLDSWNHVQIALLQLQGKVEEAASCQAIFYNKDTQKMTLIKECNYLLLSDYSHFKLKNNIPWKDQQLLSLSLQLLFQIYSLEHASGLGRISNQVQPQNLFLTPETFVLKFHDLSDFRIQTSFEKATPAIRTILTSLIQMTNPFISVASHDQAYLYFKKNYPDFLIAFESLEDNLNDMMKSGDKIELQKFIEKSKKGELFNEQGFESFVQDKLKTESKLDSELLTHFFSFSSKTPKEKIIVMNENAQNSLKLSLEAFEKALLMKDQLPSLNQSIIQQIEQECRKIEELLELTKRSSDSTFLGEKKNEQRTGKTLALLKALVQQFATKLNITEVFKATLILAAGYTLITLVFSFLSLAAQKYGVAES